MADEPQISTLVIPRREMGRTAVQLLLKLLDDPTAGPLQSTIPCQLKLTDSIGPHPSRGGLVGDDAAAGQYTGPAQFRAVRRRRAQRLRSNHGTRPAASKRPIARRDRCNIPDPVRQHGEWYERATHSGKQHAGDVLDRR